ncbi:hypothetical protein M427DRAFT_233886 [Gonapodya prolifera JEL478]|uniref:Uncharacterized protein n=1 Tax=Gonapodya prolifera (strain JEL478) TaxID=1344416 RepID=A0A139AM65_GONPJ|nr:hypothetical protein M427DRAFT_233886 [Gonapodya prolifera JEL478]|eukprot:KXS17852.1 hypothetical protein M427DRAFT_233886 [Gonapodya prolifera JEL478]
MEDEPDGCAKVPDSRPSRRSQRAPLHSSTHTPNRSRGVWSPLLPICLLYPCPESCSQCAFSVNIWSHLPISSRPTHAKCTQSRHHSIHGHSNPSSNWTSLRRPPHHRHATGQLVDESKPLSHADSATHSRSLRPRCKYNRGPHPTVLPPTSRFQRRSGPVVADLSCCVHRSEVPLFFPRLGFNGWWLEFWS